jgi:hypothetical protein
MPVKGHRSITHPRPEYPARRVLRCYSKFTIAENLHNFFYSAPIPHFSDQLLEAYVKAVSPQFDSEVDPELAPNFAPTKTFYENHTFAPARSGRASNPRSNPKSKHGSQRALRLNGKSTWTNLDQSTY